MILASVPCNNWHPQLFWGFSGWNWPPRSNFTRDLLQRGPSRNFKIYAKITGTIPNIFTLKQWLNALLCALSFWEAEQVFLLVWITQSSWFRLQTWIYAYVCHLNEENKVNFPLVVFTLFCRFLKGILCKKSPTSTGGTNWLRLGELLNAIERIAGKNKRFLKLIFRYLKAVIFQARFVFTLIVEFYWVPQISTNLPSI